MNLDDIFKPVDLSECRWVGGVISDSKGRPVAEWWLGPDGDLAERISGMEMVTITFGANDPEAA